MNSKKNDKKLCRYCKEEILNSALVCNKCNHHQNRLIQNIHNYGVLATIIMVIVSFIALWQTIEQKISAENAMNAAVKASEEALKAKKSSEESLINTQNMEKHITAIDEKLKKEIISLLEISFFQAANRLIAPGLMEDNKEKDSFYEYDYVLDKLTEITKNILPNVIENASERNRWLNEITNKYPARRPVRIIK